MEDWTTELEKHCQESPVSKGLVEDLRKEGASDREILEYLRQVGA